MHIVSVNPYFFPYHGGIERRMHGIAARLVDRGHKVTVITSQLAGTKPREEIDGIDVIRLPSKFYSIFNYNPPYVRSKGLERTLEELHPDVIDYHYRWSPGYTRAVAKFIRRTPVVFTYHNTYGEGTGLLRYVSLLNDYLFMRFLKRTQRVVAISQFIADDIVSRGVTPELVRTVYMAIGNPLDPSSDSAWAAVGHGGEYDPRPGPDGRPYACFVGRLVTTKGLRYLIEAAALGDFGVDVKVIGKGPELGRLRSQAKRAGVERRVQMLGYVEEKEKEALLSHAAFLVHPAVYESFGLAIAEAMHHGLPVVATNVGGIPEVVGDGGVLVEPRNPRMLHNAIRTLAADPDMGRSLSKRAKAHVERFRWDHLVDGMEKVFEEVSRR
ncbi:MAG: glycosyltransferase family 4 protein [Euryarchaeota archaeon]|nr:glycosyltransferase family 4 protein [Euryarchaeota archaeon]